jgi:hypothetical protein
MKSYDVHFNGPSGRRWVACVRAKGWQQAYAWAVQSWPLAPVGSLEVGAATPAHAGRRPGFSQEGVALRAAMLAQSPEARAKRSACRAAHREAVSQRTPGQQKWWDNKRRREQGAKGNGPQGEP